MTIIDDPNADARSLMNRAPCICDGEATGTPCAHFWSVIQKFKAANSDALRDGEKQRACTMTPSFLLEFTSEEKPTRCNRYERRKEPGLVNIARRALGVGGYAKYDANFAKFNPLTLEEIAKLREEMPDQPVAFNFGKNPMNMTVDDIAKMNIGIVKPGEQAPEAGLSEGTEKALEGIFGNGNVFDKKRDE